jgi:hypothetical protein
MKPYVGWGLVAWGGMDYPFQKYRYFEPLKNSHINDLDMV